MFFSQQMAAMIQRIQQEEGASPNNYLGPTRDGFGLVGFTLLDQAKTIRELVFCRLVSGISQNGLTFFHTRLNVYPIGFTNRGLSGLMYACESTNHIKTALSYIPISQPRSRGNDELVESLQDLAFLIATEASAAFTQEYYPGIPDVDPIPDEHVIAIMDAMQREMDAEGLSRSKPPLVFRTLPWERQVALAERRRWLYGKFGITPKQWKTGLWSLWNVSTEPIPPIETMVQDRTVRYGTSNVIQQPNPTYGMDIPAEVLTEFPEIAELIGEDTVD